MKRNEAHSFRLPTKGELCEPDVFLEQQLGNKLTCPNCFKATDSGNHFFLKIDNATIVAPVRRINNASGGTWITEKFHFAEGKIASVRCSNCNQCYLPEDLIAPGQQPIVGKVNVKVVKIGKERTLLLANDKRISVPTDSVARGVKEKSAAVLMGIGYSEIEDGQELNADDIFIQAIKSR